LIAEGLASVYCLVVLEELIMMLSLRSGAGLRDRSLMLSALPVAVLLLSVTATVLVGQHAPARQKEPSRARDVHLLIQTEQPTFRVGEPIRVRVSLVNTSERGIAFFPQGAEYDTQLIVTKSDGQVIRPDGPRAAPWAISGMPHVVRPHQTQPLGWRDGEWLLLAGWGYQLRTPGQYTIVGLPRLGYPDMEPDDTTVRSNTVTITIVP
jgi:hypothetical protein